MQIFSYTKIDKRKFLGTILGIICFICCILFFTYAYYVWQSDNTNVIFSIQDINNTRNECIMGPNVIAKNIGPVLKLSDGVKIDFSLSNDSDEPLITNISLNISSIDEELMVDYFKYALVVDTTNSFNFDYESPIIEGDFDLYSKSEDIWNEEEQFLTIGSVEVSGNSTYNYQFVVYIDGNVYNNPNIQNKSLISNLELGECKVITPLILNSPNLDNNLIPVYYDGSQGNETWRKADSTNKNNSWYNYNKKLWANAVIIDKNATINYKDEPVGTKIQDSDIVAFYVWIPRYKYRVWNLTRQIAIDGESIYAYPAYSTGIEIKFEDGPVSTGNVECEYKTDIVESDVALSDECIYNKTKVVAYNDNNKIDYSDAWYTHPAFTFGTETGKEKTGFWIGKFETSGDSMNPKIVPDATSLGEQNISSQFSTSRLFQEYLSDDLNAHMLTNLEWGAVVYLTHSIYGLCNEDVCQGVYLNNSSSYYTGRSGGNIAGSEKLTLDYVYGSGGTYKYNAYGYYNYKGYKLNDSTGKPTNEKDTTKIASTTGNITGVYDMAGGAYEYVMGNMVNTNNNFYPSSSGTYWDGTNDLDIKYYNSYSNGSINNGTKAAKRARLGDATAEILGDTTNLGAWKIGSGITGDYSYFVSGYNPWFYRGGYSESDSSGIFYFYRYSGMGAEYFTFRSALI